ncbi:hypothetical protein DFH07DRAFT_960839 [Mycena maculata]|uniref:Isopenicillin N synthase-like Fe(2+) 2OG dioxygenase domain-containing protein n=1 Tax=Mycena maculata TaxID=230809 RepID=A0AAD7IW99_9AGAR|nr:hypothetical protein DFH07DRAFT_960839 [Mycena maculata]
MKGYFKFAQPMDIKMKDHQGIKTKGYVPYGTFTGLKPGDWRTVEHLMLSRWDLVSALETVAPAVQAEHELFNIYLNRCNYVVFVMLGSLSDVLDVPSEQGFDRGHDTSKPCDTTLAMLSYPLDVGETLQEHTDIGSMTEFVEPRARHAVINIGDALRFVSDKKLISCVHRVIRATGTYASHHRYSLAYLRRPEQDFKYRDTDGRELTAKEWHDSKYKIYYTPHEQQDNNVLLGGMESVLS